MQIESSVITVNSLLLAICSTSVAINAFFLRGVASDLKDIKLIQERHGNRITRLEARSSHPHRRVDDFDNKEEE